MSRKMNYDFNYGSKSMATVAQLNYIHSLYNQKERDEICYNYGIITLNDLTMKQASRLISDKNNELHS
jgi:hypothetical protein